MSYSSAAVIIVTVQVTDLNAELVMTDKDPESTERPVNMQIDTVEATFYIQAYKADSPQFSAPWTPSDPVLKFDIKEELPIGNFHYLILVYCVDSNSFHEFKNLRKYQCFTSNIYIT